MMSHLVGYAVNHHRRELDFTLGNEPFKKRFANHARHTVRIQVFRSAIGYSLTSSRMALASNVRKLARAWS
jgi:hypothetical protein